MARVLEPLSEDEVKRMTVANLRKEYTKLSDFYKRIINNELVYCSHCCEWKTNKSFYSSTTSKDGFEHYACKECILDECTDYDKKTGIRTDNRDKTIATFKKLNWYFNEGIYNDQKNKLAEGTGEKVRSTAAQQWIVMCRSLFQYAEKTFEHSEFLDDGDVLNLNTNRKPRKEIIKLFGSGFTTEDYLYLQDQYDDWCTRTQVDSKSQQTYIIQICFKQLEIWKAQKAGKDTDKLVKSLNDLMNGANLQPRQNVANAANDTLTFGQLLEKWETEDPLPPVDPDFEDVDGIGKLISVFFRGHLAKMMGLKNAYTDDYDEYMNRYTVTKPEYDEDNPSDDIYNALFGKEIE